MYLEFSFFNSEKNNHFHLIRLHLFPSTKVIQCLLSFPMTRLKTLGASRRSNLENCFKGFIKKVLKIPESLSASKL